MSLKKHFIKLMEDVDMGYQAPFDANSGQGITKFAPTPANKVLKSYSVDGDFLRKAIGHGGVPQQAVDQIMTAIDGQQVDGPMGGSHFDTIMGGFGIPLAGAPNAGGEAIPPVGSGGDGMGAGAVPVGDVGATDTIADIDPIASDMSAGEPAVPGSPVDDGAVAPDEGTPIDAGAGSAIGGAGTGSPVDSEAPPTDDEAPQGDDGAVDEGEKSMSPEEQAAIRNGQTIGKRNVDTTPGDEAEGDEDTEQVDPRA